MAVLTGEEIMAKFEKHQRIASALFDMCEHEGGVSMNDLQEILKILLSKVIIGGTVKQ